MAGIEIAKKSDLENLVKKETMDQAVDHLEGKIETKMDADHQFDYNDLTNKPDIPSIDGLASSSDLSQLAGEIEKLASKEDLNDFVKQDEIENLASKDDLKDLATKNELEGFISSGELDELKQQVNDLQAIVEGLQDEDSDPEPEE